MLNLVLPSASECLKMVKTKRGSLKSPRRRTSGTLSRPISRARPTPTIQTSANTDVNVSANIRVVIRVRPPNGKEQGDNQRYDAC